MKALFASLRKLIAGNYATQPATRGRLVASSWPAAVYAVGDVHGCLAELKALEALIIRDAEEISGEKWIVMLGDYVDRGPDSAGVIDHLMGRPPADFKRICLAGNHEIMMLEFLASPLPRNGWLSFGGDETLQSYGINPVLLLNVAMAHRHQIIDSHISTEHLDFIRTLPVCLSLPGAVLVHAGIRPNIAMEDQVEEDLLWIREPFLNAELDGTVRVVHGHTPTAEPVTTPSRIGIDTGAFATGRLTAVRLGAGPEKFFST